MNRSFLLIGFLTLLSLLSGCLIQNPMNRVDRSGVVFLSQNYRPSSTPLTFQVARGGELQGLVVGGVPPLIEDLRFEVLSSPSFAQHFELEASSGLFRYRPREGFEGMDAFRFRFRANGSWSESTWINIEVVNGNAEPTALDDQASVQIAAQVTVDVLANDVDSDGDPLEVLLLTPGQLGRAAVTREHKIHYRLNPGVTSGTDTFWYLITDPHGGQARAQLSITVDPSNRPPIARDVHAWVPQDTSAGIVVTVNDSDPDGDPLTVTRVFRPQHGSAMINTSGGVTYTPSSGFTGTDRFQYVISDGHNHVAQAQVTVLVGGESNAHPRPVDDALTSPEDEELIIQPLANDQDPDGDPLEIIEVGRPRAGGTVVVLADQRLRYTPPRHFYGTESFHYRVQDPQGFSAEAEITLTITPVNDPPQAFPLRLALYPGQDLTDLALNTFLDVDGDPVTLQLVAAPPLGRVEVSGQNLSYDSEPSFEGINGGIYRVVDSHNAFSTPQPLYFHHALENASLDYGPFSLEVLEGGSFRAVGLPPERPLYGGSYDLATQEEVSVSYQITNQSTDTLKIARLLWDQELIISEGELGENLLLAGQETLQFQLKLNPTLLTRASPGTVADRLTIIYENVDTQSIARLEFPTRGEIINSNQGSPRGLPFKLHYIRNPASPTASRFDPAHVDLVTRELNEKFNRQGEPVIEFSFAGHTHVSISDPNDPSGTRYWNVLNSFRETALFAYMDQAAEAGVMNIFIPGSVELPLLGLAVLDAPVGSDAQLRSLGAHPFITPRQNYQGKFATLFLSPQALDPNADERLAVPHEVGHLVGMAHTHGPTSELYTYQKNHCGTWSQDPFQATYTVFQTGQNYGSSGADQNIMKPSLDIQANTFFNGIYDQPQLFPAIMHCYQGIAEQNRL